MGERLLCKQEVVGSIPSGSTRPAVTIRRSWSDTRRLWLALCLARMIAGGFEASGRHPFLLRLRRKTFVAVVTPE